MAKTLNAKKLPTWDLSDLFGGLDDPAIEKSLAASAKAASSFEKAYRGKLKKRASSAAALRGILDRFEIVYRDMVKPILYASLVFSENASDPARGAFMQAMRTRYTEINNKLLFFDLELLESFSSKKFAEWIKSPKLAPYANMLKKLDKGRPHRLSEQQETLVSDRDLTGRSAFVRLFSEEQASQEYEVTIAGKKKRCSQTEVLNYLYSPKRGERKAAAKSFSEGLAKESRRIGYVFNVLLQDKSVMDRYRSYKSPEAARHRANEIDQKTVDAMTDVVVQSYASVQEFYRFKRKILGVKEICDYDRYAPVGKSAALVSYAEARRWVVEAFGQLSPQYAEIADLFFENNWIEAQARPGKRGGAYCSFITPDLHPYVFINYSGRMRDVFTLAHELGHGVHAYLMRKQPYVNFDTPLTVAETASVFSEMLLFDYLSEKLKSEGAKKELFALYVGKIESVFATVHRQISMYLFERDFHAERKKGEVPVDRINEIWRNRQAEMFGRSLTLTKGYDYWWSYIPHFIHSPFYVYAYAFGELLTLSLYGRYKKSGPSFAKNYIGMLEAGASRTPQELLRPLKVNLSKRSFWQEGADIIAKMVKEVKRLK